MANAQQLLDVVIGQLSRWGNTSRYKQPITPDTEVFSDLGIYGDDLFELVLWLNKKFEVATNLELGRYAPSEAPFFWIQKLISRRQYDSLKIQDVIAAIEAKRWIVG
jgi:acyl carrier protein